MPSAMASPASELRTTSTPSPPVTLEHLVGEVEACGSRRRGAMPMDRRRSRLASDPAVAKISAPARRAIWMAASPTPPVAEWMRTRSPGGQAGLAVEGVEGGDEGARRGGGVDGREASGDGT